MTTKVSRTVERFHMLAPGQRVLCALSGGVDSAVMTHLLCLLRERLQVEVAAAHFIHGLRPEAAEDELALVRRLCQQCGIELFVERGDTRGYARKHGLGEEEAARTLRYDFLQRAAQSWRADKIATAHHQQDNAETVLFHLARGTGMKGLCGIPPVRGNIIRPLLEVSRGEIEQYAAEHCLTYAVDGSNQDTHYARNRIRHEVLPALGQVNAQAVQHIAQAAGSLRCDEDFLEQCARRLVEAVLEEPAAKTGATNDAALRVRRAPLYTAHPAVARRAVRLLYAQCGGSLGLLTERHVDDVLALCAGERPSASLDLPRVVVRRCYDDVEFLPAQGCGGNEGNQTDSGTELAALERDKAIRWGSYELLLSEEAAGQDTGERARSGNAAAQAGQADPDGWEQGWSFCKAALAPPVVVRPRQTGDELTLHGCTKTLKKWMIEVQIPQQMRDSVPIICDNRGVLAAAGIGPNEKRLAAGATGPLIKIKLRRIER